jgi:hypothetical protein
VKTHARYYNYKIVTCIYLHVTRSRLLPDSLVSIFKFPLSHSLALSLWQTFLPHSPVNLFRFCEITKGNLLISFNFICLMFDVCFEDVCFSAECPVLRFVDFDSLNFAFHSNNIVDTYMSMISTILY